MRCTRKLIWSVSPIESVPLSSVNHPVPAQETAWFPFAPFFLKYPVTDPPFRDRYTVSFDAVPAMRLLIVAVTSLGLKSHALAPMIGRVWLLRPPSPPTLHSTWRTPVEEASQKPR